MLSRNFGWGETAVSSSFPDLASPIPDEFQPNAERLAREVLQPIRDTIQRPMRILSWYRSPALNIAVGGSPSSQHTRGEAADFKCDKLRAAWLTIISMVRDDQLTGAGQLIYYPAKGFIHAAVKSSRHRIPTLCVHWPERGYRYTRHTPTVTAFEAIVPLSRDPNV